MTTPAPGLTFIDNPLAPEVFVAAPSGFGLVGENVVITFESLKYEHSEPPGPVKRVVNLRLIMPVQSAQGLALGLHDYLVKQGRDPTAAVKGGATPN